MTDQQCPTPGLFITGTDTDVGKTYVTAMIARSMVSRGVTVGAYKPACSGATTDKLDQPVWHDLEVLSTAIGDSFPRERIAPQCFHAPLAPPVAAQREDKQVDARLLRSGAQWWENRVELLLIEGVGGLLCPLTETETVADLAVDLGYPLIIVGRLGLGTINHTLLTVETARSRGLHIAGIVLNEGATTVDPIEAETNPAEIAARCECPLIGTILHNEQIDVDWMSLAGTKKL